MKSLFHLPSPFIRTPPCNLTLLKSPTSQLWGIRDCFWAHGFYAVTTQKCDVTMLKYDMTTFHYSTKVLNCGVLNASLFHHIASLWHFNAPLYLPSVKVCNHTAQLWHHMMNYVSHGSICHKRTALCHHNARLWNHNAASSYHDAELWQDSVPLNLHNTPLCNHKAELCHHNESLWYFSTILWYHYVALWSHNAPLCHLHSELWHQNDELWH